MYALFLASKVFGRILGKYLVESTRILIDSLLGTFYVLVEILVHRIKKHVWENRVVITIQNNDILLSRAVNMLQSITKGTPICRLMIS